VKEINVVLERKVREEVMKILDQRENEYLPQVILDTMEVCLASVFSLCHRSIYKYLDTGLLSLIAAKCDPFKLTSPAQHASR